MSKPGLYAELSVRLLLTGIAAVFLVGCGGGGSGGNGPAVTIAVTPAAANLPVLGSQTFVATPAQTTDSGVLWTLAEGAAGGNITPSGVYTAPGNIGIYHVVAASHADPSKFVIAPVTVHTVVTISPAAATVSAGSAQQFTATVQGSVNQAVTWSIAGGAGHGMITATGAYTAPVTPGIYSITATSMVDTTVSAPAIVTVLGGNVQGTIQ